MDQIRCPRTGGLEQGQHLLWRRILRSKKRNSAAEKRGRGGKEKGFGEKECSPRPSGNYQNSASGFSRKKVRILFRTGSNFICYELLIIFRKKMKFNRRGFAHACLKPDRKNLPPPFRLPARRGGLSYIIWKLFRDLL